MERHECEIILERESRQLIRSFDKFIDELEEEILKSPLTLEEKSIEIDKLEKTRDLIYASIDRAKAIILGEYCPIIRLGRTLIKRFRLLLTEILVPQIMQLDLNILPVIHTLTEETLALGLDIPIIEKYADKYPHIVVLYLRYRATIENIPLSTVDYIIRLTEQLAKNPIHRVALLLSYYYYLIEYRETPTDLIDHLGYYLSRLPVMYYTHIIKRLPLPDLILTTYQVIVLVLPYLVTFLLQLNKQDLLNLLFQLIIPDKLHNKFLETLEEFYLLSEEEYATSITYNIYISTILRELPHLPYIRQFIKRKVEAEAKKIIEAYPYKVKERLLGIAPLVETLLQLQDTLRYIRRYIRKLRRQGLTPEKEIIELSKQIEKRLEQINKKIEERYKSPRVIRNALYSKVYDLLQLLKTCLDYVNYKIYLLKKVYTITTVETIAVFPKLIREISHKRLPKNIYPFPILEYVLSNLLPSLPKLSQEVI